METGGLPSPFLSFSVLLNLSHALPFPPSSFTHLPPTHPHLPCNVVMWVGWSLHHWPFAPLPHFTHDNDRQADRRTGGGGGGACVGHGWDSGVVCVGRQAWCDSAFGGGWLVFVGRKHAHPHPHSPCHHHWAVSGMCGRRWRMPVCVLWPYACSTHSDRKIGIPYPHTTMSIYILSPYITS